MHMHKKGQTVSTCGQCGKTFNRKDNMLKHLQHCAGHRPPSLQLSQLPQQQHTNAPPPTFTISHRYTSMGGVVKRYNIDMQETPHPDHLSPALHLLPTLKSFQEKHSAYKSQVAITFMYHNAVDPSVVTQPPVTLTFGNDCCLCSRCCTTTRQRQPTATQFHRGILIEQIGVGILPHPRHPVGIMAARPVTR